MESILRLINQNYLRISRHAFQTNPHGLRMFQDLDDLIGQKKNFIDYIKFEYSLAIFYNLVVSFPSFIYLFTRFNIICNCDLISTIWLFIVSFIKLIETIPKGVLIYLTIHISNNSSDPIICSRRLMYMTRSNIFFYNTILGYVLLVNYTVYFLFFLRHTSPCENAPQFYFIINWLVFGFFLRLIISFINYFLHFKYGVNEADINSDLYQDYSNRVPDEVLNMIESVTLDNKNINELIPLTDENERDVCSICITPYREGEVIKLMPCNKKHIFHKCCIDKWLKHNKACPTCRREINKKLINKTKIY